MIYTKMKAALSENTTISENPLGNKLDISIGIERDIKL